MCTLRYTIYTMLVYELNATFVYDELNGSFTFFWRDCKANLMCEPVLCMFGMYITKLDMSNTVIVRHLQNTYA